MPFDFDNPPRTHVDCNELLRRSRSAYDDLLREFDVFSRQSQLQLREQNDVIVQLRKQIQQFERLVQQLTFERETGKTLPVSFLQRRGTRTKLRNSGTKKSPLNNPFQGQIFLLITLIKGNITFSPTPFGPTNQ